MEGDKKSLFKDKQFLYGVFGGIAIVVILGLIVWPFLDASSPSGNQEAQPNAAIGPVETAPVANLAINTFEMKKDAQICKENALPAVYLFSTASCPHCIWIKETFDRLAKEYASAGKIAAYHYDVETGDDLLTTQKESQLTAQANAIYSQFSPEGYIPTFVFGCKYFRIGNGYESEGSLAKEEAEFRAVIDDLLKND